MTLLTVNGFTPRQIDEALDRLLDVMDDPRFDYEIPSSRLLRLRDELRIRSLWPPVQGSRTPSQGGGGWVRLLGFGVSVSPVGGVRLLAPDLRHTHSAIRFVLHGELT